MNAVLSVSASVLALAACATAQAANSTTEAAQPTETNERITPDAAAYARAEAALPQNIGDLVRNARISVNWISESGWHFWYRRDTIEGQEWMLINADARSRSALFDHTELAAKLNTALEGELDAADLPLTGVSVEDDLSVISFDAEGKSWRYDLGSGALDQEGQAEDFQGTESPNGELQAFFHRNNIYVRSRDGSLTRQLTSEGRTR